MEILNSKRKDAVVAVDIGSTSINVAIGRSVNGEVELLGLGSAKSNDFKKGKVTSITDMTGSIVSALKMAEKKSGLKAVHAYVAIGGVCGKSIKRSSSLYLEQGEVHEEDIVGVVESALSTKTDIGMQFLNVMPQEFIVDGLGRIKDPLELLGKVLEVRLHEIMVRDAVIKDVIKSINFAGLNVQGMTLRQLASGEAVLTGREKNDGVLLLGLGGKSIEITAYKKGGVVFTESLGLGMDIVTTDIAFYLKTDQSVAEKLKRRYGCTVTSPVDSGDTIEILGDDIYGSKTISTKVLNQVIEARTEDILCLVDNLLRRGGIKGLKGGVLAGGGSRMKGLSEIAGQVFDMPVRIGCSAPQSGFAETGSNPCFAAVVGLLSLGVAEKAGEWF